MPPEVIMALLTLPCFVAIGYALGVAGNVGGPLFVLILLNIEGVSTSTAIGTAMCVSFMITASAVFGHWQQGNLRKELAWTASLSGALGAIVGASIAMQVPVKLLEPFLALVVLILPVMGLARLLRQTSRCTEATQTLPLPSQKKRGAAISALVGTFCGAFGLGGAAPIAALSRTYLYLPMRISFGLAYIAALSISLTGTLIYTAAGKINFHYAFLLALGCGLGIFMSTRLVSRIPDRILEVSMLTVMLALALFTQFNSWRAIL